MSEMHQRGMNRVGENRGVMKKKPAKNPGVCNRVPLRDIKNWAPAPSNPLVVNKQGLTEKSNLEDNNPTFVAHRPITRSFATTLSSTSDAHQQESKEIYEEIGNEKRHKLSIPTVSCASSLDYSMTTDVHEHKASDELRLPTEEEMEEMEIEIEDLMMERIPNIDSYDCDDPLSVVDYVNEIYSFYQKTEIKSCVSPDYMSTQLDINEKMRAILIDWLIEVHYKFELMDETLFRTVNIIDRFLEQQAIERKKLQLVGVTAMLLACKYEEVYVPVVEDLILISDRAYTRDEVLNMETLIINTLKFNISLPTPYVFMRRFLKAAQSDRKLELLSFFIIELCLVEYKMLKFKPSLLAAAAIYTAQCSLNGFKQWTRTCQLHSSYSQEQLLECSMLMVDFHHNAGSGKLTGVHRKYSTSRYGCAAKSEPALFLLENQSLVELSAARRAKQQKEA